MRACEYSNCTQPAIRSVELRHPRAPETRHVCLAHAQSFDDAGGADATRPLLAPPPAPYDRPDRVLGVAAVAVRTALASGPRTEREVREALLRPLPASTVRRALDELVAAGVALVEGSRWALARHAEQLAAPPPVRVRPRPVPVLEDEPVREPTPVRSPVMLDPVSRPPVRPPAAPPTLRERIATWLSENEGWHAGTDVADGVEADRGQVLSMLKRMADAREIGRFGPYRSFRYAAEGTPWPEVAAAPVAPAPAAPATKPDPQVVLDVLAAHPWVTAAQLNRHGGRVLDVALSRLVSDGAVQRATWNGIRHYALPGELRVRSTVKDDGIVHEGEAAAAAAATEDARAKVAAALVDMPYTLLEDDFIERMAEESWHPGIALVDEPATPLVPELLTAPAPVIEESPEWGIADPVNADALIAMGASLSGLLALPAADIPALPSALEVDRLRAELRETESEVDELLAALGAAPVEGGLADKLEALHEGIGGGRQALREAKADHHAAVVEAARAKADADRLTAEVAELDMGARTFRMLLREAVSGGEPLTDQEIVEGIHSITRRYAQAVADLGDARRKVDVLLDPPAAHGVLDLGEEIGSLSFDADGSISGSAGVGVQVERDLARQTLAELVSVVRMLDRFEAAAADEGMPPAQDPPQGSLDGVADRLAVHLTELHGFQSESRELARIQEVLSEFESGVIAEHDGRHWGASYQVRVLLAELLERRMLERRMSDARVAAEVRSIHREAERVLATPLATARATVDAVGGQRGEPEVEIGIGTAILTVPVTLQEMRAVAAHLWGDVIVSIFPAPVEPAPTEVQVWAAADPS